MAYLLHFKRAPELIEQKWVELRNNGGHRGDMATVERAIQYADRVANYIISLNQELCESGREKLEEVHREQVMANAIATAPSGGAGSFGMTTARGLFAAKPLPVTMRAYVENLRINLRKSRQSL